MLGKTIDSQKLVERRVIGPWQLTKSALNHSKIR